MVAPYLFLSGLLWNLAGKNPSNELTKVSGESNRNVNITDVPYVVSIQYRAIHLCSGSLIAPDIVVTAAHCVFEDTTVKKYRVRAGSSYHDQGGHVRAVADLVYHNDYDNWTADYDIAILRLVLPYTLSDSIKLVSIEDVYDDSGETQSFMVGWGRDDKGMPISNRLQKFTAPLVNHPACVEVYNSTGYAVTARMICAGFEPGSMDSCKIDSGGPLVVGGRLAGIMSWAIGCSYPELPGVFTDISQDMLYWLNYEMVRMKIEADLKAGVDPRGPNFEVPKMLQMYESGHSHPHAELCPSQGQHLNLFIFIMSGPDRAKNRQGIRQTWAHYRMRTDVQIAFLIGITNDRSLDAAIDEEDRIYGDIIGGNFFEGYYNLTMKTVSMLEWIQEYCPLVNFLLKSDDDMFINVENLLALTYEKSNEERTIYGMVQTKQKPVRFKKSKYYLSPGEYLETHFPDFTLGPAYLITGDCVKDLYEGAIDQAFLKFEDVFTTGIVAEKLNIERVDVDGFLNTKFEHDICYVHKGITFHNISYNGQFDLWKEMFVETAECKKYVRLRKTPKLNRSRP